MSKAEQQELYKRIRNEWLDSLSYNEYDSLSRSKALDSLSLFCAKHEVNAVRIAREKEKERMALICVIELEKLKVRVREETIREVISLCDERKYNIVTLKKKLESEVQKE